MKIMHGNTIYELSLFRCGNKTELGYFLTKKEANEALKLAKKYYAPYDDELQNLIHDGSAAFHLIPHDIGFVPWALACINAGEIEAKKKEKDEPEG